MSPHPLPAGTQRHPASLEKARAQSRLPLEVRQRLLDAIYAGRPFRAILRDLGLTSNRVFGLARSWEPLSRQAAEKTSSTAPTPRTYTAAYTANVGRISRFECAGTTEHQFGSMRISGSGLSYAIDPYFIFAVWI